MPKPLHFRSESIMNREFYGPDQWEVVFGVSERCEWLGKGDCSVGQEMLREACEIPSQPIVSNWRPSIDYKCQSVYEQKASIPPSSYAACVCCAPGACSLHLFRISLPFSNFNDIPLWKCYSLEEEMKQLLGNCMSGILRYVV